MQDPSILRRPNAGFDTRQRSEQQKQERKLENKRHV